MFNWLKRNPKPKPKVGMLLEDKIWGKDYTCIEIVKVSKCGKEVLYKFNKVKGDTAVFGSICENNWEYGILSNYDIIL